MNIERTTIGLPSKKRHINITAYRTISFDCCSNNKTIKKVLFIYNTRLNKFCRNRFEAMISKRGVSKI